MSECIQYNTHTHTHAHTLTHAHTHTHTHTHTHIHRVFHTTVTTTKKGLTVWRLYLKQGSSLAAKKGFPHQCADDDEEEDEEEEEDLQ